MDSNRILWYLYAQFAKYRAVQIRPLNQKFFSEKYTEVTVRLGNMLFLVNAKKATLELVFKMTL